MKRLIVTLLMMLCVNYYYSMRLEKIEPFNKVPSSLNIQSHIPSAHYLSTGSINETLSNTAEINNEGKNFKWKNFYEVTS
jgi:hypothetical protein